MLGRLLLQLSSQVLLLLATGVMLQNCQPGSKSNESAAPPSIQEVQTLQAKDSLAPIFQEQVSNDKKSSAKATSEASPAEGVKIAAGQVRGMTVLSHDLAIEKAGKYRLAFRADKAVMRIKKIDAEDMQEGPRKDWVGLLPVGKHEFQVYQDPSAGLKNEVVNYELYLEKLK